MAFLNAQRAKLAAMQQAANEQAQISTAVMGIRERMEEIERMANEPIRDDNEPIQIEELSPEEWKRKIAALSAPVSGTGNSSSYSQPSNYQPQAQVQHSHQRQQRAQPSSPLLYRQPPPAGSQLPPGYGSGVGHEYHPGYVGTQHGVPVPSRVQDIPRAGATGRVNTYTATAPSTNAFCTTCFDIPCRCTGSQSPAVGGSGGLCTKCFDIPCACKR